MLSHSSPARRSRAMTLLELVVVIAILVILVGAIIPAGSYLAARGRATAAESSLSAIRDAIVGTPNQPGYYTDTGQYPATLRDLFVQPTGVPAYNRDTGIGWRGPYLLNANGQYTVNTNFPGGAYPTAYGATGDPAVLDPWGNPIVIQHPTAPGFSQAVDDSFIRLISAGPDGTITTPPTDVYTSGSTSEPYAPSSDRGDDIVLYINHPDAP